MWSVQGVILVLSVQVVVVLGSCTICAWRDVVSLLCCVVLYFVALKYVALCCVVFYVQVVVVLGSCTVCARHDGVRLLCCLCKA